MAAIKKIKPQASIKVIVLDKQGNPRLLGTIPVWENMSSTQRWVKDNSGCELTTQLVYVSSNEDFSMENDVCLKTNAKKTINTKFTVKIREV